MKFDPQSLENFFTEQKKEWTALSNADLALNSTQQRVVQIGADSISIIYNPRRSGSVKADISKSAVQKRPCFLCAANRDPAQRELRIDDKFIALCNPMPIFRPHFTLALNEHLPQRIEDHIPSLLHISESLSPKYAVFFNGAKAGASAPDHMHFQCCLAEDLLPKTFFVSKPASLIAQCSLYSYVGHEYLALFGTNPKEIESTLRTLLGKFNPELFNLACLKREQAWEIVFIPRAQHRPSCYTADPGLLISPGTVELLGNLITVRESDFLGLNAEAIVQIFEEVLLPNSKVEDARKWLESSQK